MRTPSFLKLPSGEAGPEGVEAFVVSDGCIECDSLASEFPGVSEMDLDERLLASVCNAGFLDQNCLVLRSGGRTILFDTGMGAGTLLGPYAGRLPANLVAAGVSPGQIDTIVLTHLHCDHAWGLIDARAAPKFPNAEIFLPKVEFDAWAQAHVSGGGPPTPMRDCLAPYRMRLSFVADGVEFIEGIRPVATPGHTAGHTSYLIEVAGFRLFNLGDVCHHERVQFSNPGWRFRWDDDPEQAVRSRAFALGLAADERLALVGFHLPFPGVGRVEREADAFRFVPVGLPSS